MFKKSTNSLTLLSHYLFCLFVVGLLSLSLSYLLNQTHKKQTQIYLEKQGSLILKKAENAP
ncbi:hypothetical protein PCC8801_1493 [Rippkaea orientalis PCC 8801]|uniref:Uncharacterized protein n=1 Tax=Rippkaea orientalis (strain PCC 8801 / RF-1) TaxID=41431 RepID=B7JUK5_RIPO1|nr:hypothetical protein [Rippkaea orientalis]ACK65549.1 hypothetical protein PCC8801_1493 [Rippkaea orientalis PCC 8801]